MRVIMLFLIVVLVAGVLLVFDSWLLTDQPTHVIQVGHAAASK